MRGHNLDAERIENERQHVRGGREPVVDDDAEPAPTDRLRVECRQQIARVCLSRARGIRDAADVSGGNAADLAAREVLLDLLLHRGAHLDPGLLEELDAHGLRVARRDADVNGGAVALRLDEVSSDGGRDDAEIGDVDARRRQAGDHRALDHPAGGRGLARCDNAGARLQRRPERGREADGDVGGEIDVDEPRHAVLAEDARRPARLPDETFEQVGAGLDLLVGVDPDPRHNHALGSDRDLVADGDALVHAHVRADVARPSDDGAFDDRAAADVRRRVDDGARRACALAQRHTRRQHRVRTDGGLRRDSRVVAEIRGTLDRLEIVHVDAFAEPDVAAQADAGDVEPHFLVERVEVRLPVLVEVADVLPVALEHAAVDRPPHLQQEREQLLREVVRTVGRDVAQHLRLEHVDAGVDRVREHLPPRRLLEKALDASVLVGDDDPELERVLDRLQADGDRRLLLAVELHETAEIDVTQRVAGDDEKGVVETAGGETHRSGGARWRFLDRVCEVHPERLARAEIAADRLRQECDRDDHVLEAVLLEQVDDVLHARLADDRHERLRLVGRERTETRALAAGHDDGLHCLRRRLRRRLQGARVSRASACSTRLPRSARATAPMRFRASRMYNIAAATAPPRPIQKSHSGHSVASCVTMRKPMAAYRSHVAALPRRFTSISTPRGESICQPAKSSRSRAAMTTSPAHGRRP